jgi:hypothetical protein
MKNSILFLLTILLLVAFQNCNNLVQSSDLLFQTKEVIFNSQWAGAEFYWDIAENANNLSLNQYGRVSKWIDQGGRNLPLYPILIPGSTVLDIDHAGKIVDTPKGPRVEFAEGALLKSVYLDATQLASDEYSIIIEISEIHIPLEEPRLVRVLSLLPITGYEAGGQLELNLVATGDFANIVATQKFSDTSMASNSIQLPLVNLKNGLGISVRWSSLSEQLTLAINGELAPFPPTTVGTMGRLGSVARSLTIHSNSEGSGGSFQVAEVGLFKRALLDIELMEFSLGLFRTHELKAPTLLSTISGLDSFNGTELTYSDIRPLFQKSIGAHSCLECHGELDSRSSTMAATTNGQRWVQVGDSDHSIIIQALRHQASAQAMPKGGGQMNEEDIRRIESWINHGAR